MLCQPSHARRVRIGWIAREEQGSPSTDFVPVTLGCQGFQCDDIGIGGKRTLGVIAVVAIDEAYRFGVVACRAGGPRRVDSRHLGGQGRRIQHDRVSGFFPRMLA